MAFWTPGPANEMLSDMLAEAQHQDNLLCLDLFSYLECTLLSVGGMDMRTAIRLYFTMNDINGILHLFILALVILILPFLFMACIAYFTPCCCKDTRMRIKYSYYEQEQRETAYQAWLLLQRQQK